MAASVSQGQRVAHPSVTALAPVPSAVPKSGTVLMTGLTVAVPSPTGHAAVVPIIQSNGVLVQWDNQPLPVLHPVTDLT